MQLSVLCRGIAVFSLLLAISGCGGGNNSSTVGKVATITVTPTTLSLQTGEVAQLTATLKDSKGNIINTVTPTWTSDASTIVQVSTTGAVCAGTWNTAFTICTPGPVGAANVTASGGGVTSDKIPVSVHQRIANLTINAPATTGCISSTKTLQVTAVARDAAGNDITSTVGQITFSAALPDIATTDNTGLITAKRPGQTQIIAKVSNITSLPVTFTTCPPAHIDLAVSGKTPAESNFSVAVGGTQTLATNVIDTQGNGIGDIVLTFSSYNPVVMAGALNVSATAAGTTAIVASCTPPSCNAGLNQAVYSNIIVATVTGTSASTAYVTGSGATTIIPIDTATNVAGTAITLPTTTVNGTATPVTVNSFVFARNGARAYLGTSNGLLVYDVATNAFPANLTNLTGKVLSVSPNSQKILISDAANGKIYVVDGGSGTFETFSVANAIAADWTPDSLKAFIVSSGSGGNSMFVYSPLLSSRSVALSSAANDVSVLSQGSIAYVAGGAAPLTFYSTCDNAQQGTAGASATPLLLRSTVDAAHVLGLTTGSIVDDQVFVDTQPCPPTAVSNTVTEHSFGSTFTPNKLVVDSASAHAYATSNTTGVLAYNIATGVTSTIALAGGATGGTTADLTLDGKQLYVGALGSNDVHVIDTATASDVKQIAVGLKKSDGTAVAPDFVVVRPK